MLTDQALAFRPAVPPSPVLRHKPTHGRMYGRRSLRYMLTVKKWRCHFYRVILDVLKNAGQFNFPLDFAPLEKYLDGFNVIYTDINELPEGTLKSMRGDDEIEEGWNIIDSTTIYIFYDANLSMQRQRFTIVHEWGHVFQKLDEEFKSDIEAMPNAEERKAVIESIADHFAAFYLAPDPLLKAEIREVKAHPSFLPIQIQLAHRFDISPAAMEHRMTNYYRQRAQQ
ncbi:MAG: ImmA/IrrE family metallo-endopeptidase [bacterium]|nr:ImmA/IrrE family metallo-endopeptidase [bacterium]